jgi:hypothetical protein
MNFNTIFAFIITLLILFILSAFGGYRYGILQKTPHSPIFDTTYVTYVIPGDTIEKVQVIPKIIYKNNVVNITDSVYINFLLDSIDVLYKKLSDLEVKHVAILDTIFPKGDTLYLEFDKVTDIFAPIYLRRAGIEIPYITQTIYVPCPKSHSVWLDIGIGAGALSLGYLIGNVSAR